MNKKHFHQKAHLFCCAFPLIQLSHKEHLANLTTAELSLEGNHLAVEEPTLFRIPHVVTTPAAKEFEDTTQSTNNSFSALLTAHYSAFL